MTPVDAVAGATPTSTRRWPSWLPALVGWIAVVVASSLSFALLDDNDLFKVGLILIFFVAAAGLHVLVNWAGELSLAQGSIVGLAALSVARLSVAHEIHPLLLLPVGAAVGFVTGLTLAAVAYRASGFYVAIVTLAAAVVIDRYFFTQEWLVPGGSLTITHLDIGGVELQTSRQLYPFLVVITILAVLVIRRLSRSRFARGMYKLRQHPDGASAQGVNVAATRALAYVIAGVMAGVAGGLSAMWIQSVSPTTYAQSTNLNFLTAVVVAGPGSLVAVGELSAFLEGFRLFISSSGPIITYIGPVGLIVTLVLVPGGVAAQNRQMKRLVVGFVRRPPRPRRRRAPVAPVEATQVAP